MKTNKTFKTFIENFKARLFAVKLLSRLEELGFIISLVHLFLYYRDPTTAAEEILHIVIFLAKMLLKRQ